MTIKREKTGQKYYEACLAPEMHAKMVKLMENDMINREQRWKEVDYAVLNTRNIDSDSENSGKILMVSLSRLSSEEIESASNLSSLNETKIKRPKHILDSKNPTNDSLPNPMVPSVLGRSKRRVHRVQNQLSTINEQ